MSTLRITNIEAKADPSSPTVDEKIKLTNSNGDILVHIDGKTSGITTIGINTTAGNIKFDQNSNVVVTGIITATKFVGTIEPTTLTVGGDLTIPDKIIHTGDTNTSIRFPAADTITAETAGSERFRIDSNGNIGIGDASPTKPLTVGTTTPVILLDDQSSRTLEIRGPSTTHNATVLTTSTHDLLLGTNNAERLRITSAGDMGLGTGSPTARLDVRRGDADGKIAEFHQSTGYGIQIRSSESIATIRAEYNQALVFETGTTATERLRITSGGDVLIADTTNSVWNDSSGGGINLKANGQIVAKKEATSTADPLIWLNDTGQTTNKFIAFAQDGTEKSYIGLSGNDLLFGVNGGDRARIDSDGHLQIRREGVASMSNVDTRHTRYIIRQNNGQEAILGSVFAQGKSGWGGDLVFASKNANGNPSSGLTERMRIDASGYVTKPNTPAFFVYKNQSSWALAANDVFVFNTAELNVGGHYNTTNGRFTAPITARYVFHFYSIFTGNANSDSIEMYKNGARMYGGDVHFTNDVGSAWDCVHYSRVIQLSSGDYVHMQTRTGHTFHGNHWGGWSGYMLG